MSNQYGYSEIEILAMILITAFSNFMMIFNLLYAIKSGQVHYIFIMVLILTTSFMYHLCDSLGVNLFMNENDWHILDNIGSICGLVQYFTIFQMEVFNYFMQNKQQVRMQISWIFFFILLISQQQYAFDLPATFIPILISISFFFGKLIFIKPALIDKPINKTYLYRGILLLLIAIFSFYKGLDDKKDYLRAWHGLWHICIASAIYHIFQVYEEETFDFIQLLCYFKSTLAQKYNENQV